MRKKAPKPIRTKAARVPSARVRKSVAVSVQQATLVDPPVQKAHGYHDILWFPGYKDIFDL